MLFRTTPQERQALAVTALLLIAGAGARIVAAPSGAVEWDGEGADTLVAGQLEAVRAAAGEELERERIRSSPLAPGERIDPNEADELQLDRLPRVGPSLAARIVEYREANGRFRTLADLDEVPGVGPALLESLAPHLTLPAGPTAGDASRRVVGEGGRESGGAALAGGGLNVNRAAEAELESLPGIGPALAGRIVASRRAEGDFERVEDLLRVPGIGPALLERLRPLVKVR